MQPNSNYVRRALFTIGTLSVLSLAIACGGEAKPTAAPQLNPVQYALSECKTRLYQVESGIVSPNAHMRDLEQCLPEAVAAKNSGMLKGFVYQPSDKELETLLTELFSDRAGNEQELQFLVQSSIDSYKTLRGKEAGTIIPTIIGAFGQRIPSYVVFTNELYSSASINNDADARSIAKHELRHVKDWYDGIILGDVRLSFDTISPKTVRIDFLQHLMELRAVYDELKDAYRERVEIGRVSVSPQWFGSQAANYSAHWDFLKNYPATDLEEKARELQFRQFEGIKPETNSGGKILIRFNLFGKQDTAEIDGVL